MAEDRQRYEKLSGLLKSCQQEHLLKYYEQLGQGGKNALLEQIEKLEFARISGWVEKYVENVFHAQVPSEIAPAPFYPASAGGQSTVPGTPPQSLGLLTEDTLRYYGGWSASLKDKYSRAVQVGVEQICGGKVGAFVVAGGQGTRLGFDGPKGNYPVSPIKEKTLFAIFAEEIVAAGKKYRATIPWYVMTSPINYSQTVEIFAANDYYGLAKEDVIIFQQGTMPNFGFDGKILMADKDTITVSPDGHGGSLKALYDSGALADMKKRGVEFLSYWQVDNPLVKIIDPLFIGLHVMDGSEMSSKALKKAHSMEKVGNFCLVEGKVTVIEYSDLTQEQAERRGENGELVFELGSIGIHVISADFVERLNKDGFALPFHRAVKKIPHIDSKGDFIRPDKPNGVKLEAFVFDALPLAEKSMILQTIRSEEFAPVKNASGVDSPEVTRRMMIERAACWLEKAEVKVPRKEDGTVDCVIEMAVSFAMSAEDVKSKADMVPEIKAGGSIYLE